ncbi:MAG: sulfite exporter TauE/SafE family protein [Terracidiphilus sp.]|jgi:uncharacterized membrane protein YfcA
MAGTQVFWLMVIFFLTSAISVVTGSTSLITVPAMLQFHIEPRTALATNMFALTFMSVGGTLPFLRSPDVDRRRLPLLIALTLLGSVLGAFLLLRVPTRSVPMIVSVAVIAVAAFSVFYRKSGMQESAITPSTGAEIAGFTLTFLLGIYGGFFSGGYVTILTAVYVAVFRFTFVEAIATTKLMNIFSSAVATGVFMWHGLVNYRLGLILGATMFVGALVGARFAIRIGNLWLRRIFLTAVWALGLKALVFDVWRTQAGSEAATPSQ